MKSALQAVLVISACGIAFSGTLTYREMIAKKGPVCAAPGAPGTILGYPACVYGLVMYLLVAIVATLGLMR